VLDEVQDFLFRQSSQAGRNALGICLREEHSNQVHQMIICNTFAGSNGVSDLTLLKEHGASVLGSANKRRYLAQRQWLHGSTKEVELQRLGAAISMEQECYNMIHPCCSTPRLRNAQPTV
jgi:hypothetical protein